jgi:predicted kinase
MASVAVLVNGIPGSGKSTLAADLAAELGFLVVAKDAIKEALADIVSARLPARRIGALASNAMWALVGMLDGPVIIESLWATGRDEGFFERGVSVSGIESAVEVWCEVSIATAKRRLAQELRGVLGLGVPQ